MKLYNYFRSGTSHRLRIALRLKGLDADYIPVNLLQEEQTSAAFLALNPQGLVPALVLDSGEVLIQSPAIIEWLEERYPEPALLPSSAEDRARVRALAALIGCDIHPLNNRRVLQYLRQSLGAEPAAVDGWAGEWIGAGLDAYEALLAADTRRGRFSFGAAPTLADVYLIPQVDGAKRFAVDLGRWPRIAEVYASCLELPAFIQAAPGVQPDAR